MYVACSATVCMLSASSALHTSWASSIPGLVTWDLWLKKWHWGRSFPHTSVFPANFLSTTWSSFNNCPTINEYIRKLRNCTLPLTEHDEVMEALAQVSLLPCSKSSGHEPFWRRRCGVSLNSGWKTGGNVSCATRGLLYPFIYKSPACSARTVSFDNPCTKVVSFYLRKKDVSSYRPIYSHFPMLSTCLTHQSLILYLSV